MIELWGMSSPNVQKVLIALEELALPYRFHYVDVLMNEQYAREFEALTPNRKVPVIVDSDGPDGKPLTLWESGAILLYLAEKADALHATDAVGRHVLMQWLMFQMAGIGPMFGQHSHFRVYAKDETHAYSRARYGTEVKRLYDVVERRLGESRHLAGPDYTIADIAAWPWLRAFGMRGLEASDIPNVARWIEEIGARPAVTRAMQRVTEMPRRDLDQFAKDHPDELDRYLGRGRYVRA